MKDKRLCKIIITSIMAILMVMSTVGTSLATVYETTLPKILDPTYGYENWSRAPKSNFMMKSQSDSSQKGTYSHPVNYNDSTPDNSGRWGGLSGSYNSKFTVKYGDRVEFKEIAGNKENPIISHDWQLRYYDKNGNRIDSRATMFSKRDGIFTASPPSRYSNETTYGIMYLSVEGREKHTVRYGGVGNIATMQGLNLDANTDAKSKWSEFRGFSSYGYPLVRAKGWPFSAMMFKIEPQNGTTGSDHSPNPIRPNPRPTPKPTPTPRPENKYSLEETLQLYDLDGSIKLSSPSMQSKYYVSGLGYEYQTLSPFSTKKVYGYPSRPTRFSIKIPEGFEEMESPSVTNVGDTTRVIYKVKKSVDPSRLGDYDLHQKLELYDEDGETNIYSPSMSGSFELVGDSDRQSSSLYPFNWSKVLQLPAEPINFSINIPNNGYEEMKAPSIMKKGKITYVTYYVKKKKTTPTYGVVQTVDMLDENGEKINTPSYVNTNFSVGTSKQTTRIPVNKLDWNESITTNLKEEPTNFKIEVPSGFKETKPPEVKRGWGNMVHVKYFLQEVPKEQEDLEIVSIPNVEANEEEDVEIPVTIRNNGKKTHTTDLKLGILEWDGYSVQLTQQVANLKPNETRIIKFITKAPSGTRKNELFVFGNINPNKNIEESNYINNRKQATMKINKPKNDLEVVSVGSKTIEEGTPDFTIPVVVRNNGVKALNSSIIIGGGVLRGQTIPVQLQPKETKTINVKFTTPVTTLYPNGGFRIKIEANINPRKEIIETNYENNIGSGMVTITEKEKENDLEVVSVGNTRVKIGNEASIPVAVRNNGEKKLKSFLNITLSGSLKGGTLPVTLNPKETKIINIPISTSTIESFPGEEFVVEVKAEINPKKTIKENNYNNNIGNGKITIYKEKEIPDLEVVEVTNKTLTPGEKTTIPVKVRNNSKTKIDTELESNVNNKVIKTKVILEPNEEKIIEVPFIAPDLENGEIKEFPFVSEINKTRIIVENNYNNNIGNGKIIVKSEISNDLEVVRVGNVSGYVGEEKTLEIEVRNNGTKSQTSEILLKNYIFGGGVFAEDMKIPVENLQPKETRTLTTKIVIPDIKNNSGVLKATINPNKTIEETNYDNNSRAGQLAVKRNDLEVVNISPKQIESGKTENIPVTVKNNTDKRIETSVIVRIEDFNKEIQVILEPKETKEIKVPYTAPKVPSGTSINYPSSAEINPKRTIEESNYANNLKKSVVIVYREKEVPEFSSCSKTIEWSETDSRSVKYTYAENGEIKKGTRTEYGDFKYSATLIPKLTIKDDRELQSSSEYIRLKSGYGFKTIVDATIEVKQISGDWTRSPKKKVSLPDKAMAKLSWKVDKIINQPNEVPLIIDTNNKSGVKFVNRVNPASATGAKVIYTHIDLAGNKEKPVKHPFSVYVSGGGVDGKEFCIDLPGQIEIFGNMYEDYHVS